MRILAIDDNKDNLISLNAIIKDIFPDSIVDTALNGSSGIEIAIKEDPDVILLDILMPEMDGFEVCRHLKKNDFLKDIPVVFLTAIKQSKQSRIEALEIGAEAFLSKPIDITELTAQIRAMVKIKIANKRKRDEKEHLALLVTERTRELEKSHNEMIKLLNDLKSSEIRYRRLFESATDGILIIEPETARIIDVNQHLTNLLGFSHDEFIGKNLWDLKLLFNIENPRQFSEELCKKGYSRYEDIPLKTINERIIHVEVVSSVYFADKERVIQCNVRDITERKRAEEQIRTLSKAVEQGPSAVVITNKEGKIEFINRKFTSMTQYKLEDVKGRNPRVFNPGHIPEKKFNEIWEKLRKGITWEGEVQNRRKDKTLYLEETIISPMMNADSSISNYILIMNDITEKKQMLNDLIVAKEKAEESDRLKSTFLANMSHEIRTPLNSIIGFSDLMLKSNFDPANLVEFAQIINTSGNDMLSMINNILDISMIETCNDSLSKDIFSVNMVVKDVHEKLSYKANEKGIELRLDSLNPQNEIYIDSDMNKLKHILINIVSNAIKFSKEGFVEIGIRTNENNVCFNVKDTGIGIPEEFQDKIFERFFQVQSDSTREYGGNGLGLAISKHLVELLGGKIGVESKYGIGSKFYFTIPIWKRDKPYERLVN